MSKAYLAPHAIADRITLQLSDFDDPTLEEPLRVNVTVETEGSVFEDFARRTYDLSDADVNWSKLSFRIQAELEPEEIDRVLPPTSDVARDAALIVSITCPSTKFRHGVVLEHVDEGNWRGSATLQRDDLKRTVLLKPLLVRRTKIPEESAATGVAIKSEAIIGRGAGAAIYIDAPSRLAKGALPIKWEDFTKSKNEWRRSNDADLFHLEPYGDNPTVFLNARYTQLRALLELSSRRGVDAALRDMAATLIAQTVWTQLAVVAFGAMGFDEETGMVELPTTGWKKDVIKRFLPSMFPAMGEDQQVKLLASQFHDPNGIESLISKVGTAVQQMVGSFKMVEDAIRALEHLPETWEISE